MSCRVCRRDARGFGYRDPNGFGRSIPWLPACSKLCLDILHARSGEVFSPTEFENQALEAASAAAGEYLEGIGKTDLATMTGEEWMAFIQIVFVKSTEEIQRLSDESAVPF